MTVRRGLLIGIPLVGALLAAYLIGGATHPAKRADAADFAPLHVLRNSQGDVAAIAILTVRGHQVPFVVDTGASSSVIDLKVAEKLGFRPIGKAHPAFGVGGKQRSLPILIDHWSIGPVPLPKLRIDAGDLSKDTRGGPAGLLGSDVLSRFKSVTLDFGRQQLQLGR